MDLLAPLSQTFDHTAKVLAGLGPDQLGDPTPCTEWDVRTLVSHTIGVVVNMGRGASGDAPLADGGALPLEADIASQFRSEADRTLGAWRACRLDSQVDVGAGPMLAMAALSVNLVDTTTHGWDIARATGQEPGLPHDLAATVLTVGRGFITDDLRARVGIRPAITVPDDASPTDQLVAFMGRQP